MPIILPRQPTVLDTRSEWESTHGFGTEVTVVSDNSDSSYMHNNGGAFEDLLYSLQAIDAPAHCPITSCVVSVRSLFPDFGAAMFMRAWVAGAMHTGSFHSAPNTPPVVGG